MQKVSKQKTANIYAAAWIEAAFDANAEDTVFLEVENLLTEYNNDVKSWKMLAAPINDKTEVANIIKTISQKIKLSVVSEQALLLIAENGRLGLFKEILEAFKKLYYAKKGIIEVIVETAVELTKTQDKKLKKVLEDKLNAAVLLTYEIKPEVLGGLAVRFNSQLFDDTVLSKINRIEKVMRKKGAA